MMMMMMMMMYSVQCTVFSADIITTIYVLTYHKQLISCLSQHTFTRSLVTNVCVE